MTDERPFIWEKSYPAGVRWDAPVATSSLTELLDRSVAAFSDQPALSYFRRAITYRQLGEHVDRMAAAFHGLGVRKGTPVALFLPNTPWHPVSLFAILKCGGRAVHISPLDAEREIVHKIKDSGARLLITTDLATLADGARKLAAAGLVDRVIVGENAVWLGTNGTTATDDKILSGSDLLKTQPLSSDHYPAVSADDVALLQYTGGTTGLAKAALLTHANLTAVVSIMRNWAEPQGLGRSGEDVNICVLPLFHIFALMTLTATIDAGAHTVLHPRFDAEAVVKDIEHYKPNGFTGVPTMWIAIANLPGIEARDLSSLKTARSGGAACPVEIEGRIQKLIGCRLGGGWGMTETSPAGTTIPVTWTNKAGTIGLPLPGITLEIVALDDPRRRLGVREVGEIRVKGPNVIKAYHNRPEENAKAFVDGFLLTGDIGYYDEDGFFFIVDRKKDMIISGGFNVYPRTIEEAIYEHPSVAEVIVIGVPDDYRGEAAKAFVALKPGKPEFSLDELKSFLADKIGRHEMPAHLEFRAQLPKTSVGKFSKKELVAEERAKTAAVVR